jgi:predicted RecA/RadA family phage recombinase
MAQLSGCGRTLTLTAAVAVMYGVRVSMGTMFCSTNGVVRLGDIGSIMVSVLHISEMMQLIMNVIP